MASEAESDTGQQYFCRYFHANYYKPGRHNLRSFLAANLTQNHFLIARILSIFCDIRDKSAGIIILQQNETIFDIGNG